MACDGAPDLVIPRNEVTRESLRLAILLGIGKLFKDLPRRLPAQIYLQFLPMATAVRSFAKINIGLAIGPLRDDNFHNLRTVYQTIGLHDVLKIDVARGTG